MQSVIKGEAAHPNSRQREISLVDIANRLDDLERAMERIDRLARLAEAHPLIRRFLGLGGR